MSTGRTFPTSVPAPVLLESLKITGRVRPALVIHRFQALLLDEGEAVYESSELGGADEIPPAALVEIAVGVIMQCLALRPADAQIYLLGRARSEARTLDDLAGDIVQRRRP